MFLVDGFFEIYLACDVGENLVSFFLKLYGSKKCVKDDTQTHTDKHTLTLYVFTVKSNHAKIH